MADDRLSAVRFSDLSGELETHWDGSQDLRKANRQ
jgi:hypothetical protein